MAQNRKRALRAARRRNLRKNKFPEFVSVLASEIGNFGEPRLLVALDSIKLTDNLDAEILHARDEGGVWVSGRLTHQQFLSCLQVVLDALKFYGEEVFWLVFFNYDFVGGLGFKLNDFMRKGDGLLRIDGDTVIASSRNCTYGVLLDYDKDPSEGGYEILVWGFDANELGQLRRLIC